MFTPIQSSTANGKTALRAAILAMILMLACLAGARAANAETSDDGWKFTVAPYVWGASLDGTVVVKGRGADVDLSASDILNHLNFGAMGTFVARRGDWGIFADAVWVDLGVNSDRPPADVDPSLGILTVQGVRRLNDIADFTFGARYDRLNAHVRFNAPINVQVEQTRDWVEPVVGIHLKTPGSHRWHGNLIADIGGFGVGSDLSWQVFPSVGYDLGKNASVEAGWRFLSTDYESGDGSDRFEYQMHYQGPAVGCTFKF